MIFRQILHEDLRCASYLIGDEQAGIAAVVDPQFDVDAYLELARYLNVRIAHILETHNHADHVSGHGRLVAATGATIHIHRLAEPDYDHEPFDDGWELALGRLRVRALHTPGHRPEHTAFALIDTARADEPWAVLTGDTLFVGDIARPDLAIERVEGARGIFRSLRDVLLRLPATCEVWPGHLGGSLCGSASTDPKGSSTIGFELAHNPALSITDEERFVAERVSNLAPRPPNFLDIVALNRGPLVVDAPVSPPLEPRQVAAQIAAGALVVDVRDAAEFDDRHVPDTVCIPVGRPGFGTRLAWLAGVDRDVAFIGRGDDDGRRAVELAAAVGVRRIVGHLRDGFKSWVRDGRPTRQIARMPMDALTARVDADASVQLLDVREDDEWERARIPGSVHAIWREIDGIPSGIDPDRPIAVMCGSGMRAGIAAGLLLRAGAKDVIHVVDGGVERWASLGRPVTRDAS